MSTNVDEFTVPEKILLAADHLDKQGQSPFSAEALMIVAAWEKFGRTFGLKGFEEHHPDSNKILSSIMGEKGLVRRGWLVKMGQKLYALTREGRQVVRRVTLEEEDQGLISAVKLPRDQERFVLALLDSSAVQKFEESRKGELTFADACRFWGINDSTKGEALDARLSQFQGKLAELDRAFTGADAELSNGRCVDAGDIRALTNIHRYLEDRFDRHLNLLRNRAGRR